MSTERRDAPQLINGALNQSTTKFGVDHRLLVACVVVSLVVFLFVSKLLAFLVLPAIVAGASLLTKREPQMFALWFLSFRQGSDYDPGKGIDR